MLHRAYRIIVAITRRKQVLLHENRIDRNNIFGWHAWRRTTAPL